MKRNLLLTPGPTKVPQELCEALSRPIIHHRTPLFQEHLKETTQGLQYVYQSKNDIYLIAASGTGAMEASVCSLLSPGDTALTVEGGKFGERWTELCQAYQIKTEVISVQWGKAVDPKEIKERLEKNKDIKAVFTTLCETSTGVTTDIESIGSIVKETDAVLVVDAVSGLCVTDLQTDNWFVDIAVSASHKGLMLPPGVAFLSVSEKAVKLINKSKSPRYYFDLRGYKKAAQKDDTPFTPAIGIIVAMTESLKIIKEAGLQNLFNEYERLAKGTRYAAKALGLTLFADESCISNVCTAINIPEGIDGGKIVKKMRDEQGISIAGGQAELKGKIIRIAHMGCVNEEDLITGFTCLEKVLEECGYSFESGVGVNAAKEYFQKEVSKTT